MMSILEELWYGNIGPDKISEKSLKKIKKYMDELYKYETELLKTLDENQKDIFEKYQASRENMSVEAEKENFIKGFTLGVRIMTECMENDLWSSKE